MSILQEALTYIATIPARQDLILWLLFFFPLVILVELPFYILVSLSVIRWYFDKSFETIETNYTPKVTCIITAYNEKISIFQSVLSILEQIYDGYIEIIVLVDGALENHETDYYAKQSIQLAEDYPKREIKIVSKTERGGHPSSMNLGLKLARGEILFAIDGDSLADNTMVHNAVQKFIDPNVVALSGSLRPYSKSDSLVTKFQLLEYMLGIQFSRTGLGRINVINNVSGAMGIFRVDFLKRIGGWSNTAAEDLDLTLKMIAYFKRYPKLKVITEPSSGLITEVPDTLWMLIKQRVRWDGDMYYIYIRRHWRAFTGSLFGWRALLVMIWYGLFFQIMMPLIVIIYILLTITIYPLPFVLAILFFTYCYYMIITLIFFLLHLIMTSERKKADLSYLPYLFLMPIYSLFMRIASGIYILIELIFKSHRDTSMLPWRVLKRSLRK